MSFDSSGTRSRKVPFILFLILFVPFFVFLLVFLPNPLTDLLASRICAEQFGRSIELRGVRLKFPRGQRLYFSVDEIDLRKAWQGEDQELSSWLVVKNSRWALRFVPGTRYLRLLEARSGDVLLQGGLRSDGGRITRWDAAFRLPRSLWGRFPAPAGKRFAQDPSGRRLLKLTWSGGHYRLWGRSGPVLEAGWR